jgi:6-phosphogluconolactonase
LSIRVYKGPEELDEAAAGHFVERAAEAIRERGRFTVALAGGSTPKATYEVLVRDRAEDVHWPSVHVFFGDERTVPSDHEDSNYRMAREALLDHVDVGSVHRMRGELPPEEAAADYEEELRGFFGEGGVPSFDLVMLGIGGDGHTASLFPETSALEVTDRLVVANPVLKLDTTRITLTVPIINAAREILFLVAGEGKAEALKEILEGDADPRGYPAKLIQPSGGPIWMADRAAARLLRNLP